MFDRGLPISSIIYREFFVADKQSLALFWGFLFYESTRETFSATEVLQWSLLKFFEPVGERQYCRETEALVIYNEWDELGCCEGPDRGS